MTTSSLRLSNNALSTLAANITDSATSLTVATGDGAKFPTLAGNQYFMATLVKSTGTFEIVKCTARSGDMLTIVRAQEGTTASVFTTADRIEHRLTAGSLLDQLENKVQTTGDTGSAILPAGNTAQRDASPSLGAIRFNSETDSHEGFKSTGWAGLGGGGTSWQSVKTSSFNAASGNKYPINTTSAAITVTLPSSPAAGDYVVLTDYARTFQTNNLTINPNGGKIQASTSNIVVNTNGASVSLVYIDSTQGWICYDGFSVNPIGSYSVNYLVVAGGGGGGATDGSGIAGGGGGAGGLLTGTATFLAGSAYTISIGAGGSASASGSNSSISTIATALGGGAGAGGGNAANGGSGGGGNAKTNSKGLGTAGQGNNGSDIGGSSGGGAGGGAGAEGGPSRGTYLGANGGSGLSVSISGSAVNYAGGGGGGGYSSGGAGGSGGGGAGGISTGTAGTANTGGGGGGAWAGSPSAGGAGGSGIVILSYLGAQRGTGGTVTSVGGYTIHTFTSSGTFNA